MYNIPQTLTHKNDIMGSNPQSWFKFYKVKGHQTKEYYQLNMDKENLIHEWHLKKYVKAGSDQRSIESNS